MCLRPADADADVAGQQRHHPGHARRLRVAHRQAHGQALPIMLTMLLAGRGHDDGHQQLLLHWGG